MTPPALRRCPNCAAENPLDATSCAECGFSLAPMGTSGSASARAPSAGRPRRPRRPAPGAVLPGAPEITEEPGKIIPRRRHSRAGLFGVGGDRSEPPGGAPSWIWLLVVAAALAIAVVAAVSISTQRQPLAIPGATREQAQAADSLVRVLERDSLNLEANVGLGNLFYDTHGFGEAVRYYRRALAVHPDIPDVRVDMAVALHQSGRSPEAVAELAQVIAAHPEHPIARLNLGIIYEAVGRLADAESTYRAAERLPLPVDLRRAVEQQLAGLEAKKKSAGATAGRPGP